MKLLFSPARAVMARLSYTRKFLLVLALIVLPLLYLSSQLLYTLVTSMHQTDRLQIDLNRLSRMTLMIRSLERLRDIAPIQALTPVPQSEQTFTRAQKAALDQLGRLIRSKQLSNEFRQTGIQLRKSIRNLQLVPGSEGFQVQQVFQNVQHLVAKAYEWRQEEANRDGLFAANLPGFESLNVFLFSRAPNLLERLGAAQAYGSFFLQSGFVHSGAAGLLDMTWQNLEGEIRQLGTGAYAKTPAAEELDITRVKKASRRTLDRFDQDLIQVVQLSTPWKDYYRQTGTDIGTVNLQVNHAFNQLERILKKEHQNRRQHLRYAIYGLATVSLAIIYLLVAFYLSVKSSVRRLISAARRVAKGDFETPVRVGTRDEMQILSLALDDMREQLRVREEALRDFGLRDGLTGIHNRRYFDEALENAVNRANREQAWLALVLIDLDYFKTVNDSHGHLVGDGVLKQSARLFETVFRRGSDVTARYGGEEFAAILPGTSTETACELAEKLRAQLAASPLAVEGGQGAVTVTASLGVAVVAPGALTNSRELVGLADEALYRAKHLGRNRVEHKLLAPPELQSGTHS